MQFDLWWWLFFNLAVVLFLLIDIVLLRNEKISSRKALALTSMWVIIALLFAWFIAAFKGSSTGLEFLTGYVIEESLSIDNLFVFLLIFQYFKVPEKYRYQILMWGIFGALIMRFTFIFAGIALIQKAHWILYLFGAFLVFTGITLFKKQERQINFEKNLLSRLLKKCIPTTQSWSEGKFFVRINEKLHATPLLIILLTIESTDLLFALDSIPAVFAITLDPFIVYSCNALAILGLRPLFFVLQDLLGYFSLLHYGVCIILIFVGLKMLLGAFIEIPTLVSLGVILTVLLASMSLSYFVKKS